MNNRITRRLYARKPPHAGSNPVESTKNMHPMFVGFRTRDGKKKTDGTNQSAIEMTERPSAVKAEKSFLVKLSFMR